MKRPLENEYHPYFNHYINLVLGDDYENNFRINTAEVISFFKAIPEDKHDYKYAEGKWSIKEVLNHITDTERVFSYRTLVLLREGEAAKLAPFEENLYGQNSRVGSRSMASLIEEFTINRKNLAFLFENASEAEQKCIGEASGNPISVSALSYITLGHAKHHMNVLNERYL